MKQEKRIHHRQVHTLSDLKNSPPIEQSSEKKPNFKKKEKSNVFRKESINTALISNGGTESRLGQTEYDANTVNTKSLEEGLSDSSIEMIKHKRFKFKQTRPEFTKTMEDNFKVSEGRRHKRKDEGPKELNEHRQLLKESQSKFEKKCFKSVSIENKTRNSKESKGKTSLNTYKSSRENNNVLRRKSKEPPYKPVSKKSAYNHNVSKNDSINKMKMSFKKSGSFSKRSRLLRTDEEDEDFHDHFRENGFKANREKLRKEIIKHKTPQFKVIHREGEVKPKGMNEYYDEYMKEEEQQRIDRANPSEFDSDIKVSDSSHGFNLVEQKDYVNANIKEYTQDNENQSESFGEKLRKVGHNTIDQDYSKNSESIEEGLDRYQTEFETREDTSKKNKENSVMFTDIKDPEQGMMGNLQRGQRQVKSEFKQMNNPAQEPLHCSNVEVPELGKKLEAVLKEQARKKKEREKQLILIKKKINFNDDIDNLNLMYKEVMKPFMSESINEDFEEDEEEEEQEETEQEYQNQVQEHQNYHRGMGNYTRKVSNLEVNFLESESNQGGYQRGGDFQDIEESEYEEESDEEEQHMQKRRDLLSEKNPKSRRYPDYHPEYMNAPSYTHAQKNQGKKYILESNISPEESDVVSRVNLSNQQPLTISKKKPKINRKIAFLSNSKSKNSGFLSSQQLQNMASIEKDPYLGNDYNQIDEASMSKEDFSRSKHNNMHMVYRDFSDSNYEGQMSKYNIFDLTYCQDLIPYLQQLQKTTMDKLVRFKLYYNSSRVFVKSVEKQMYKLYHIASGEEHVNFQKIKISKKIQHGDTKIYFERKENKMNELLQSFMFLVCKTRLETASQIFIRFQETLTKLFPTFKLLTFDQKKKKLENLQKKQITDMEEIQEGIDQFINFFFRHLTTISPKKDVYDYDQKTKNYVIKSKLNKSRTFDSGVSVVAIKEKFSHFYKRESNRFNQIVHVQGKRGKYKNNILDLNESQNRMITKEELGVLIENFEVFSTKCFKSFFESCEKLSQMVSSKNRDFYQNSLEIFETQLMRLYVLEQQAKAKIFRKVHQIILCLNTIIIQRFTSERSSRQSMDPKPIEHIPHIQYKSLIKTAHSSIMKVLKDGKLGSVELLLNWMQNNPEKFQKVNNSMLIQMLNECAKGQYETTVDYLFQKPKQTSMRYSSSFNIRSSNNSKYGLLGKNFLDYESMDYGRNVDSSFGYGKDNNGVLLENSEFYDASFNIIKNFLQTNLILLSHYVPDLF